jgi:hypothetical protein
MLKALSAHLGAPGVGWKQKRELASLAAETVAVSLLYPPNDPALVAMRQRSHTVLDPCWTPFPRRIYL